MSGRFWQSRKRSIWLKKGAETEHAGLKGQLDEVISHAAIVGGNEIEDYQIRHDARSEMLHKSDNEIRAGEKRLRVIDGNISSFRLLKIDLPRHFPGIQRIPPATSNDTVFRS